MNHSPWQSMDNAPRDGTVIEAWHRIHKVPVSVRWMDEFPLSKDCPWLEKTGSNTWPEEAFTHFRYPGLSPEGEFYE